jgi:hypothetical protein
MRFAQKMSPAEIICHYAHHFRRVYGKTPELVAKRGFYYIENWRELGFRDPPKRQSLAELGDMVEALQETKAASA